MRIKNRILLCVNCYEKLSGDKSPYTSEQGYIYRVRTCNGCGMIYYTKQGPEEITGKDMLSTENNRDGEYTINAVIPSLESIAASCVSNIQ